MLYGNAVVFILKYFSGSYLRNFCLLPTPVAFMKGKFNKNPGWPYKRFTKGKVVQKLGAHTGNRTWNR